MDKGELSCFLNPEIAKIEKQTYVIISNVIYFLFNRFLTDAKIVYFLLSFMLIYYERC